MKDETSQKDPVIERVRQARREISARFGHDPQKLTAYYIERQKRHEDRLICSSTKRMFDASPCREPSATSLAKPAK